MKKILFTICCMASALAFSGCSSDDDSGKEQEPGNSSDYIATKKIKTVRFDNQSVGSMYYYNDFDLGNIIYEDFSTQYRISLETGELRLKYYERMNGSFILSPQIATQAGIEMLTGISSLEVITDSDKTEDILTRSLVYNWGNPSLSRFSMAHAGFLPGCGYIILLTTESGDLLYVRMRATGYELNDDRSLANITLEYQLF